MTKIMTDWEKRREAVSFVLAQPQRLTSSPKISISYLLDNDGECCPKRDLLLTDSLARFEGDVVFVIDAKCQVFEPCCAAPPHRKECQEESRHDTAEWLKQGD